MTQKVDAFSFPSSLFAKLRKDSSIEVIERDFWNTYDLVKNGRLIAAWRLFADCSAHSIYWPDSCSYSSRYLLYCSLHDTKKIKHQGISWLHLLVAAGLHHECMRWILRRRITSIQYFHSCFEVDVEPQRFPQINDLRPEEIQAILKTYELEERCFSYYFGATDKTKEFWARRSSYATAYFI